MLCNNLSVSEKGHLLFAGRDTVALAEKYSTPLYVMDEEKIRENCRLYKNAFEKYFGYSDSVLYASKANSFKQLYRIMTEEGMGIDVVSSGEIYTAKEAGFDLGKAFFHSNNKTDRDISYALDCGVGYFVADNEEELISLQKEAERRGVKQKVLLRITPGIDPHTYAEVSTGNIDSKFGTPIDTGDAGRLVCKTLGLSYVILEGFHCHVGSQVFAEDVFEKAAVKMLGFIRDIKEKTGYSAKILNLGGGFGVRYTESDPVIDVSAKIESISRVFKKTCEEFSLEEPKVYMEPGRSIVANAGMALYTVGTVKKIAGFKNYISVDGSMADCPRYALYKAKYTSIIANKANEPCTFKASLVGRCCESGDILQEGGLFPEGVARGDIAALCTAGAYHYSMSSNYNRLPRPATLMLSKDGEYIAVKAETFEDLCRNDM